MPLWIISLNKHHQKPLSEIEIAFYLPRESVVTFLNITGETGTDHSLWGSLNDCPKDRPTETTEALTPPQKKRKTEQKRRGKLQYYLRKGSSGFYFKSSVIFLKVIRTCLIGLFEKTPEGTPPPHTPWPPQTFIEPFIGYLDPPRQHLLYLLKFQDKNWPLLRLFFKTVWDFWRKYQAISTP